MVKLNPAPEPAPLIGWDNAYFQGQVKLNPASEPSK
jgi:hypothetical protein